MAQLESALNEKDQQLLEGTALFDQLKRDFKYNLKLLHDRDAELEQSDIKIAALQEQVTAQLNKISELGVGLKEATEKAEAIDREKRVMEENYQRQVKRERAGNERRVKQKESEHSKDRLEWDSRRRALEEHLQVSIS